MRWKLNLLAAAAAVGLVAAAAGTGPVWAQGTSSAQDYQNSTPANTNTYGYAPYSYYRGYDYSAPTPYPAPVYGYAGAYPYYGSPYYYGGNPYGYAYGGPMIYGSFGPQGRVGFRFGWW